VGGSDLVKIKEQLGDQLQNYPYIDYIFSENGLVSYQHQCVLSNYSMCEYLGETKLKKFINFCLRYLADIDIPIKRGTFIELRQSMINISPIGRNCSQHERDEFEQYDNTHHIRQNMIHALRTEFPDYGIKYSIGGQISFDVLGTQFDKTFCLQYVSHYETIYFFGDKTYPGGNDHEICHDNRVIGYTVTSYEDTMSQLRTLFHQS
jgi:phosphomannomutase